MTLLLRPVARLAALVVLGALALGALAVAIACLPSGGWEAVADRLGLESAPRRAAEVQAGAAAWALVAVCAGALAVAVGALVPRRTRSLTLRDAPVEARPRAVREAAQRLAASRGAAARVRVRVRRRRLRVDATFPPGADIRAGTATIERALHDLATAFGLRLTVRARRGDKGARVR